MLPKFTSINTVFVFAFFTFVESKRLSWCDPELCPNGKQHIACGHDGVSEYKENCLKKKQCEVQGFIKILKLFFIFHFSFFFRNGLLVFVVILFKNFLQI